MTSHPHLLSPLDIGRVRVRNRMRSTAHGAFTDFYRPGEPADRYVAYQQRRAGGGCGLVILQPLHVRPSSQVLGHHVYDPDDLRPKLARMADALHAHDTPVIVQLIHFGAEFASDSRTDLQPLWAFSPLVAPSSGERAHAMTDTQVHEVVEAFAATAAMAVDAGVDGVELHAAHGYLVAMTRAQIADPDVVAKVAAGRADASTIRTSAASTGWASPTRSQRHGGCWSSARVRRGCGQRSPLPDVATA